MKQGFFFIFISEIKRIFSNYRLLFLLLGFPIGLFIYYSSLLNQGVPEKLPIVLLDQDNSKLSRQLTRMVNASPSLNIVSSNISEEEGKSRIRTDHAFAMIIIPSDFEKNLYRGTTSQVVCYYNNQYLLVGGLINKAFQTVVETFSAGVHINSLLQGGQTSAQAYSNTVPVNLDTHILFNPYTSYSYFLSVALIPMAFHIIIMVVTLYALGRPLKYGEGQNLYEMGNRNVWSVYFGTILPYTLLFIIVGFFMNSLIFYQVGTPFKGSFFQINLITLLFILVVQLLALLFVSITTSLRTALTFGGGFTALAFSFVGYTFPMEGLPVPIVVLTHIFPLTSYVRLIVNTGIKGELLANNMSYLINLITLGVIGLLTIFIYKKRLIKGSYNV